MGKFDVYYEQLKNKMTALPQDRGQWRQSLQEAMAGIEAEREADIPSGAERLEGFDYVQNCNSALMNCAAEKIKKEASWDATVRRIRIRIGKPDLQIPRGSSDWLVSLMKTDDSDESMNYNDKLVGQMALCTGAISQSQYVTLRQMGGYSRVPGDSRNAIIDEQHSAAGDLLNALDRLVQKGRQQLETFQQSVNVVCGLEANNQALNQAFAVIESDEIRIMDHAEDCLNDIKNFKKQWRLPKEDIEARQANWPPRIANKEQMEQAREAAENIAGLTYDDMIEKFGKEVPAKENGAEQKPAFTEAEKYQLKNQTVNDYLQRYGLEAGDKFSQNDSGYTLYQNQKGDTVIMRVDEIKADGGGVRYEIRDDAPGRYVNHDLARQAKTAADWCKWLEEDDGKKHSQEYQDLNEQVKKLADLRLGDQPSWPEVKNASEQIGRFNTLLKKFFEMQKKIPLRVEEREYDKLVKKLTAFSTEKNAAISALYEHLATRDRFELNGKEISESIHAAQEKNAGNRPLTTLQNYKIFARSWSETMGAIEEDVSAREKANLSGYSFSEAKEKFDKFENPKDGLDRANGIAMKAILGEDLYKAGVEGKVFPEQLANVLGKSALACGVIEQLLDMESKMGIEAKHPIQDLITNGKLSEVVDMVKNSRSFGENYSFLDLSHCTQKRLDKILAGKEKGVLSAKVVAKDIMKSYLSAARDQKQAGGNQAGQGMEKKALPERNNQQGPQNQPG